MYNKTKADDSNSTADTWQWVSDFPGFLPWSSLRTRSRPYVPFALRRTGCLEEAEQRLIRALMRSWGSGVQLPVFGTQTGEAGASSRRRGPRPPKPPPAPPSARKSAGGRGAQAEGGPRTARARPPPGPDGELAARPPAAAEGGPPYSSRHGPSAHTTAGRGRSAPGAREGSPSDGSGSQDFPKACPAFGDGSRRGRGFLAAAGATPAQAAACSALGPKERRGQGSPSCPLGGRGPTRGRPSHRPRKPERQGLPRGGGGHARPRPERAQGAGEPKPPARGTRPNQKAALAPPAQGPRPAPTASSPPVRLQPPKVVPPIVVGTGPQPTRPRALSHHDRAQGPPSAARQEKTVPSGGNPGRAAPVPYTAAHGPRGCRGPKGESPSQPLPEEDEAD
ncbi:basic salivary proline-rich protein 1-like [Penaeus vannamei]|uniref:basic salivary proline-rich protein 1-like n=1 Tax=Penaeus vannamei TaxID=6689 RepID=UPI00387F4D29